MTPSVARIASELELLTTDAPWHGYVAWKTEPGPSGWNSPGDKSSPLTIADASALLHKHIGQGHDVYYTLAPFRPDAEGRADTTSITHSVVLWADYDAHDSKKNPNPITFPLHLFDPTTPLGKATQLVASGRPGHWQPRIHLDQPIPAATAERLNHALKALVGGDHKWPINTYLRLPGSPNCRDDAKPARTVQRHTAYISERDVRLALKKGLANEGIDYDWDGPLKSPRAETKLAPSHQKMTRAERREVLAKLRKNAISKKNDMASKLSTANYITGYTKDRSALFVGLYKDLHRVGLAIDEAYAFLEPLAVDSFPRLARHIETEWPTDELKEPPIGGRIKLIRASEIKIKRVKWLWHHRIPLGGLSLIGGREGQGKSTIVCDIIAKTTLGTLEGELFGTPHDVIYMTTEDSWESTVVPRLMAAGADLNRVHQMMPTTAGDSPVRFNDDLDEIATIVEEMRVGLIAVDPMLSALGDDIDDTRGKELRKILEEINAMADRVTCAVFGIIHFRKLESHDIGLMFSGSLVWSQVPRATLGVIPHPEKDNCFILGRGKNNLAPPVADLEGTIETVKFASEDGPITTSRIVGLAESDVMMKDALRPELAAKKDDALTKWIITALERNGEMLKVDVVSQATKIHSVSERTVERKFGALHGQSRTAGFGADFKAYWSLPGYKPNLSTPAANTSKVKPMALPKPTRSTVDKPGQYLDDDGTPLT